MYGCGKCDFDACAECAKGLSFVPEVGSLAVRKGEPECAKGPSFVPEVGSLATRKGEQYRGAIAPTQLTIKYCMYGARFRQDFALEDAIGSHACSLEANMRVTNGIPLESPLLSPLSW
jgi:hypothetical protein